MKTFTIAELTSLTGVPPASIHHYLKQGLLPAPEELSPNRFLYDDRHVQGLRLIRALRERRRIPLALVRRIMPELLYLQEEEAFRPDIWDRALAPARRQHPSQRILTVARDAFTRRGYGDVNVEEICEAARLAKGSFYRHYHSKEELFGAVVRSASGEVLAAFRDATVGAGRLTVEEAGKILAGAIRPYAPLFLEFMTRSLKGRTEDGVVAAEIFRGAYTEIGRSVRGRGSVEERGTRAIGVALGTVLQAALATGRTEPAPVSANEEAGDEGSSTVADDAPATGS
jgi:AcrR family transcriptional regulator